MTCGFFTDDSVSLVGYNTLDRVADESLDLLNDGCECVAVVERWP